VMRFSFFFNFYYDFTFFQVIWAIGASMVVLSALIYLNQSVIVAIGLILLFGHNAFDGARIEAGQPGYVLWTLLNQAGPIQISEGHVLLVAYPVFPWLGIMLTGYGIGKWYLNGFDGAKRKKLLLYSGASAIAMFVILRYLNLYGDPSLWQPGKNGLFTLMAFLNCTKYPVSLLYTLMTVGPVLIILSAMEKVNTGTLKPLVVFGRVPLFYYVLHFYLIHLTALIAYLIVSGKSLGELDFRFSAGFGGIPAGAGFSLPWVYVAWLSIVIAIYPVCKWYNQYKSTHHQWWLSYL